MMDYAEWQISPSECHNWSKDRKEREGCGSTCGEERGCFRMLHHLYSLDSIALLSIHLDQGIIPLNEIPWDLYQQILLFRSATVEAKARRKEEVDRMESLMPPKSASMYRKGKR